MEKLKALALDALFVLVIPVVACVGFIYGVNACQHHNRRCTEKDGTIIATKVDGPFTHTKIQRGRDGSVSITKYIFDSWVKSYYDKEGDGKVDTISILRDSDPVPDWLVFERKEDFQTHKADFAAADNDMKQQLKRFRKYL